METVVTRCYILKLKSTKFAPDPAGRAYNAPSDPLVSVATKGVALREPTSNER